MHTYLSTKITILTTAALYQPCTEMLSDAGVRIFGYVHSKQTVVDDDVYKQTGLRPTQDVYRDIGLWFKGYSHLDGFAGIFVDEASTEYQVRRSEFGANHLKHYRSIVNYIRNTEKQYKRGDIILNGGTLMSPDFFIESPEMPDPPRHAVIFEDNAKTWRTDCPWYPVGPLCNHPRSETPTLLKSMMESGYLSTGAFIHGYVPCKAIPITNRVVAEH